jgi:hypothetical protein
MIYVMLDIVAGVCFALAFVDAWRQRGKENAKDRALRKVNR